MFHFWINTAFIDREYLCLHKAYIDGADKDKSNKEFDADFKLELFLDRVSCAGTVVSGCKIISRVVFFPRPSLSPALSHMQQIDDSADIMGEEIDNDSEHDTEDEDKGDDDE